MNKLVWFKIRAIIFANLQKIFGFILNVPVPPKFSVGAFIEHEGKFLVLNLTYRKGFAFPGGMVEPGESLETALKREVFEETNLKIESLEYITSVPDLQYGLSVIAVVFKTKVTGIEKGSHEGKLSWEKPEAILNNSAYKNWSYALKQYIEKV